jgi:hypothetical protein
MRAKMTTRDRVTLPKAATNAVGPAEYFDVQTRDGRIILTPVRVQGTDAIRARLAELGLNEQDAQDAVAWSRGPTATKR